MEKIQLKSIVHPHNRTIIILFFTGVYILLYFLSGAFYLGNAGYFMLTPLDHSVPFLPWTSFIYVMLYPFLFHMCFSIKSYENLNKALYAFLFLILSTCLVFILYPVAYPRDFYPLPYENSPGVNLLRVIRFLDRPVNCFPSLHVSNVFLFSFVFWHECKKRFVLFMLISTAISLSTLTTKQHYILDVIGGLTSAAIIYLVIWKMTAVTVQKAKKDSAAF
jgi:membrane-associated phospholipid phosphatase